MQNRSSIARPRYLVAALLVVAATAAGCGGGDADADGPIAVDSEPIERGAYAKPLGAAVEAEHAREDAAYRNRLLTVFTSITPENAMKWERIHPRRGEFDFAEADRLVRFAQRTGKRVRGHPLVWDQQLPGWLAETDWAKRELRQVLRRHIRTLVSRYRGKVAEWDVVNEPLASDGSWTDNLWHRVLGREYVEIAFRAARRADPDARLFLNEVGAERKAKKSRALFELARSLRRRGVPIDAIGFQYHTTGDAGVGGDRLRELFRTVAQIGLDAAITEMDVPGADPARQAEIYGAAARACADAANCTGLTVWGITDRWSWIGADARPLPFDEEGEPKPAFGALVEPLRSG